MVLHQGHVHDGDEVVARRRSTVSQPYGAAQFIALAMGVFFVVIGAVALARTGMHSWTGSRTYVAGMGATTLLAVAHVVIGVIMLASATSRSSARGACMAIGAALIALGIIALIQPVRGLAWTTTNGVAYLIAGAAGIVASLVTPTVIAGEERIVRSEDRYVA